jgi:S1-C subfamily serine protease
MLALGALGGGGASTQTLPTPATCPKGYEALCKALNSQGAGSADIGSQAGTGGKSTAIVRPEAIENNDNLRESYSRFSPSIVRVQIGVLDADSNQSDGEQGTAFYISKDGYALTSASLVSKSTESTRVIITNSVGVRLTALIVRVEKDTDLALLKVPSSLEQAPISGFGQAPGGGPEKALMGERVSILGFPLGLPSLYQITGTVAALNGPRGTFYLSAAVSPGMSGSPVLGEDGQLIGVLSGGFSGRAVVIPIQYASPLLQLAGIQ